MTHLNQNMTTPQPASVQQSHGCRTSGYVRHQRKLADNFPTPETSEYLQLVPQRRNIKIKRGQLNSSLHHFAPRTHHPITVATPPLVSSLSCASFRRKKKIEKREKKSLQASGQTALGTLPSHSAGAALHYPPSAASLMPAGT